MDDFILNKKIEICKWISWQIYDNCVYIIDERTEYIFLLDDIAYEFWIYLIKCETIKKSLINLKNKFNFVSDKFIQKDFIDFVKVLANQEIVEVV